MKSLFFPPRRPTGIAVFAAAADAADATKPNGKVNAAAAAAAAAAHTNEHTRSRPKKAPTTAARDYRRSADRPDLKAP